MSRVRYARRYGLRWCSGAAVLAPRRRWDNGHIPCRLGQESHRPCTRIAYRLVPLQVARRAARSSRVALDDLVGLPLLMNGPCPH